MPRMLALEWDSREARVAVANLRSGGLTVEQAFSVPLSSGAADPATEIVRGLNERRIARLPALVAVGRASIELKRLSIPPAPDDELPDLVRFQAQREFNSWTDDWALDFTPLDADATQPRDVLAAALSPDVLRQVRGVCEQANIKAERLVLRPCAAAALVRYRPPSQAARVQLLVDLLGEEVDLTVVVGEHAVFLRTARLSLDHESQAADPWRPLVGEIRRTLAAAHHQMGSDRVEAICLFHGRGGDDALADRLTKDLRMPVAMFNPFAGVELGGELRAESPENPGRFAPLLGMLVEEAHEARPAFDFLNPRRPAEPPSRKRPLALAGASTVSLLVLAVGWGWWTLSSLDRDIAAKTAQIKQLEPDVVKAQERIAEASNLDEWLARDVVWLDELAELSAAAPPAQDVVVTDVLMNRKPDGGELVLTGVVRDVEVVDDLESELASERRRVEGRGRTLDPKGGKYPWRFTTAILIAPDATPAKAAANAAKVDDAPPVDPVATSAAPSAVESSDAAPAAASSDAASPAISPIEAAAPAQPDSADNPGALAPVED